jgi:flagellar motor switch protein FliN/FliY
MDDVGSRAMGDSSAGEFGRGLLRITVPVTVTLASHQRTLGEILEIVPGVILEFDKSCRAPLSLEVGGTRLAEGQCVQVGDTLGLRITSLVPGQPVEPSSGPTDSTPRQR